MHRLDTSRSLTRAAASAEIGYMFKEATRDIQLKSFQTHGGQLGPWRRTFLLPGGSHPTPSTGQGLQTTRTVDLRLSWPGKTPSKHSTLTSVLAMRKPTGATMDTS